MGKADEKETICWPVRRMCFGLASLSLSFLGYSVFWREKGMRGSIFIILYNFRLCFLFFLDCCVGIYIEL